MRARPAKKSDLDFLDRISRELAAEGDLYIAEEREDFFKILACQLGEHETYIFEQEHNGLFTPKGCVTLSIHNLVQQDEVIKAAYLRDLKVLPSLRDLRWMIRFHKALLDYAKEKYSINFVYASMMTSNRRINGLRLLTKGEIFHSYNTTAIQFTGGKPKPKHIVEKATAKNYEEIESFLIEQSNGTPLSFEYGTNFLQHQLDSWENFSIENFYFIRGTEGKIEALCSVWDQDSSRKTRVDGYSSKLQKIRSLYNLEASLRHFAKLPKPGGYFKQLFVNHLSFSYQDSELIRSLLLQIYRDYKPKNYHFIYVKTPHEGFNKEIKSTLSGFRTRNLRMDLVKYKHPDCKFSEIPELAETGF